MSAKWGVLIDYPLSGPEMSAFTFETREQAEEYANHLTHSKAVELSKQYQPRTKPCITDLRA